jgi:hypothetical protein
MKLEATQQFFMKVSSITFNANLCRGSETVSCIQTVNLGTFTRVESEPTMAQG